MRVYDWTLVHADGTSVDPGERIKSGKEISYKVLGGSPPHKPSSSGKVYVESCNFKQELYPSVLNLKWIQDK